MAKGTLAHAYLFFGSEGVGKKATALECAKSLICRNKTAPKFGGCGECDDCRRIEMLSHPDLIFLSLEHLLVEEENKREIGIKNIHELQRLLGLSAWGGGWRTAVIDGAERLSHDGQAALLKILEEPGARITFFLITTAPGALLATIRSRAVPIAFSTLTDETMLPLLEDIPASRRALLLELARGRPGILQKFAQDRKFLERFGADYAVFKRLLGADLADQFAFSERESREPGRLEAWCDFLLYHMRGELHAAVERGAPGNSVLPRERVAGLHAFIAALLNSSLLLATTPVNRRLLADSLFFELYTLGPSVT